MKMADDLLKSKLEFEKKASERMSEIIEQNGIVDKELKKVLGQYESERVRLYEAVRIFEEEKQKMIYAAKADFDKEISASREQMENLISNMETCSHEFDALSRMASEVKDNKTTALNG